MYPLNGQYATKEKDGRSHKGKLGNCVSLADGPDGKANGSYQFSGTNESYIEFPNNAGTLYARPSITMLCWVYISNSSGPLFIYYNKNDRGKHFGMAIAKARLAYFSGIQTGLQEICSKETLGSNRWHYVGASYDNTSKKARLWVNGSLDKEIDVPSWNLPTEYSAVRMGAVFLKNWHGQKTYKFKGRIATMQIYNLSLTEQQIKAVKYVSGQGRNIYVVGLAYVSELTTFS